MAGLAIDGSNPDVSLLYDINGLAGSAPDWFDRGVRFAGEYGIMTALVVVALWCWWSVRRQKAAEDSVAAVAGLLWAPLAAGVALLINMPIREFVGRARPFAEHPGIDVLTGGQTGFSFVSDHATVAMALAAGIFVAHRGFGLAAIGLALAEGFSRVYLGVHYPTDVIGGFALGTAVVLLLAPLAMALLTPLVSAVCRSGRAGLFVRSRAAREADRAEAAEAAEAPGTRTLGIPEPRPDDNNLAA